MRPTIANEEKSSKRPTGMDPAELVEGIFDLPSDGTELFLALAIAAIFFLWWLLAPVVRSLFEQASGGGTGF